MNLCPECGERLIKYDEQTLRCRNGHMVPSAAALVEAVAKRGDRTLLIAATAGAAAGGIVSTVVQLFA